MLLLDDANGLIGRAGRALFFCLFLSRFAKVTSLQKAAPNRHDARSAAFKKPQDHESSKHNKTPQSPSAPSLP